MNSTRNDTRNDSTKWKLDNNLSLKKNSKNAYLKIGKANIWTILELFIYTIICNSKISMIVNPYVSETRGCQNFFGY